MDVARGGRFTKIPTKYPSKAWYTYNDATCGYPCMVVEYCYWTLTSMLGAQKLRKSQIKNEYKLYTRALVKGRDSRALNLLSNRKFSLPTVLPTGAYKVALNKMKMPKEIFPQE